MSYHYFCLFCKGDVYISMVSIYLFILVYASIFFSMNIFLLSLFQCSNCTNIGQWEPLLYGSSRPFHKSSLTLSTFLTFCPHKMFIVYFALSVPQPWNQLFLQEVLIPFSEVQYLESNIWVYDVLIAVSMSSLPGSLVGKANICDVFSCVDIDTFSFIWTADIILIILFSYCNFLLQQRERWFPLSSVYVLKLLSLHCIYSFNFAC